MGGVWDARAKWDQLLDQSPPEWARAARDVGDTVAIAASILKHEVGSVPDHASVVELAALIISRRDRMELLDELAARRVVGTSNVPLGHRMSRLRPYCDHLPICPRRHYADTDGDAPACDCGLLDIMDGQ